MKTEASQNEPSEFLGIKTLLERASHGDESMVGLIRELLEVLPAGSRTLCGDLAHEAERTLVRAITDKNIAQREAINLKLAELRRDVGGPCPHPLERLLVERVVLCWLHVHHADLQCGFATSVTFEHGDYLQRAQDRAQSRYLAAIKSLATVRRLVMPIKVDVTVAGTVESQPRPACRRPVEVGHIGATESGQSIVRRKTVKRSPSRQ